MPHVQKLDHPLKRATWSRKVAPQETNLYHPL